MAIVKKKKRKKKKEKITPAGEWGECEAIGTLVHC